MCGAYECGRTIYNRRALFDRFLQIVHNLKRKDLRNKTILKNMRQLEHVNTFNMTAKQTMKISIEVFTVYSEKVTNFVLRGSLREHLSGQWLEK